MANTKLYCSICDTEIPPYHSACIRCGSEDTFSIEHPSCISAGKDEVAEFITKVLMMADGFIVSPYPCFVCGGKHVMVWPGKRDKTQYELITPLTTLPQCPIKVWTYGDRKGISMPLNELVESLKVEVKNEQ